jgi:hypothetical protein
MSVISGHDTRFICYQYAIFTLKDIEQNRAKLGEWKDTLINLRDMAEQQ